MKNNVLVLLVIFLLTISTVSAASVAIQLKETVPGIAMKQTALLKYDIVNMDVEHKMMVFLVCQNLDDTRVTSSYGAGTSTSSEYISPLVYLDQGPYQGAMTITIASDSIGDKNPGCTFKYVPFKIRGIGMDKLYLRADGQYTAQLRDEDYRELRLDKTVPFVGDMENPQCPPEKTSNCKSNEVIDMAQITEVITEEIPKEEIPKEEPEEVMPPKEVSRGISGTSILMVLFAIIGIIFIIYVVFSLSKKARKRLKKPKKHCSECGTPLTPKDEFCPKCGEKI